MRKKAIGTVVKSAFLVLICLALTVVVISIVVSDVENKPLTTVFGYGACFVITGSMEPQLSVNDIIIVQETQSPALNDVVLYRSDGDLVVHRVVALSEDGETVTTRGDANKIDDPPFNRSEIIGKVVFVIPALGQLVAFLKSPYGIVAMVSLGIALYIAMYLFDQAKKKDDDTNE